MPNPPDLQGLRHRGRLRDPRSEALLDGRPHRGHGPRRIVQIGTPEDLYRRPRDRFVAEFIGETNLLPGRVESRNGDEAVVELKSGKIRASTGPNTPAWARLPGMRSAQGRGLETAGANSGVASSGGAEFRGRDSLEASVNETTYLGEMAQHSVTLADGWVPEDRGAEPVGGKPRGVEGGAAGGAAGCGGAPCGRNSQIANGQMTIQKRPESAGCLVCLSIQSALMRPPPRTRMRP